jgi:hypothetical protein
MNTMIAAIAPGPSQQRRTERHQGDVDLALAGQALDLATKQVKGDHEQQQTSGGL